MSSHPDHFAGARPAARLGAALLALLALGGCTAQLAYRDAQDLQAKARTEEALQKYQQAIVADPGNAQYRVAFLQARDRAANAHLLRADRFLADGHGDQALQAYQQALAVDPGNERARAGLRSIEADNRHSRMMDAARAAIEKKDADSARQKLAAILTERPAYEPARLLLAQLNEQNVVAPAETGLSQAFKQPITIEFRDAPLKQVFEVIARRSGLNILFDRDVKTDQRTSIFLKNSTVEAAIYYLLLTNQLEQRIMDGNTILVYPNLAAKLKDYQEMVVKTFYLANADAKLVANTLKTILKTRDVVVDEKLNLLIVRDGPEAIRLAEKLVALQDVAEPEVMLEVEVLEIKRSRLTALGVAWPASVGLAPLTTAAGGPLTIAALGDLNRNNIGVSGISATINANTTDGDTNILANPRIRVRNKQKAKILIGEKVPNITTTVSPGTAGFASQSISYVDVGLNLSVEPTIYLNNEVAINIQLEVSNLVSRMQTDSGAVAYQIGTRQASTTLQLKDGENQVLAGLIDNEQRSTGNKVPGAGDIPILGRLFGSNTDDSQRTEIVLSITPHLIRNIQRPASLASEFSAGTESSFRRQPDMSVKLPTQLPPNPALRPAVMPAQPQPQPVPASPTLLQAPLPSGAPVPAGQGVLVPLSGPGALPPPAADVVVTPVATPDSTPTKTK